jgi:hypothetical protein
MLHRIVLSIIALAVAISLQAQSPQKFKFQAVARDASGVPYASENIAVRVSLVREGVSGLVDYAERHEVTTSPLGVFDLEIGGGVALSGMFEDADWALYPYYLKIDIDPDGGSSYLNLGTSQLLSVPYAIYASQSGSGGGGDPTDELQNLIYNPATQTLTLTDGNSVTLSFPGGGSDDQQLTLSGTTLSIEDGNSVDLATLQDGVNDADADPTNELQVLDLNGTQLYISDGNNVDLAPILPPGGTDDQELSLSGTNLTIEDGNSVDLSILQDGVNDADSDPTNEIETWSTLQGIPADIADGDDTDDADSDPTNELQDISFDVNTNELTISGGSTVTLPSGGTDADADPTNELQVLDLNGTQLYISDGNNVDLAPILPPGGTDDQELSLSGTNLTIEDGNSVDLSILQDGVNDADSDPTNEIETWSTLQGIPTDIADGDDTDDADADPTNELQDISFDVNTNELTISGGSTVTLPSGGTDADADPTNELQVLDLNGTQLYISDGNNVDLAPILPPGGTDDQELSLSGTNLTIEDGNSVDLSILQDGVNDADSDPTNEIETWSTLQGIPADIADGDDTDDADADPTNELQDISFDVNTNELTISGGSTVTLPSGGTDADADPTNELQVLDLNGTQLYISDGNNVDLAPILPPGGTDDQELSLSGTNLTIEDGNSVDLSILQDGVNDADADPTNEFQVLDLNGTQLYISDGNNVDLAPILPPGGTDDQELSLSGTNLTIEDGNSVDLSILQDGVNDADSDPTNEIETWSTLQGIPADIADGDDTDDADADPTNEFQVLDLNGTQLYISDGNNVDLAPILPPGGTDDQELSLSGTNLTIEDGNSVDLSILQDGVNDADSDPTNEIETWSTLQGIPADIADGDDTADADADPANELQSLSLTGNQLSLSNGGGNVDLSGVGGSTVWNDNAGGIHYTSGKVGIGTDTPFADLDIQGENTYAELHSISGGSNGNATLNLLTDDDISNNLLITKVTPLPLLPVDAPIDYSNQALIESGENTWGLTFSALGTNPMRFYTNEKLGMFLADNGRLGIGTSAPQTEMHLLGSDARLTLQAETEDNLIALSLSSYPEFTGTRDLNLSLYPGSNTFDFEDGTSSEDAAVMNAGADVSRLVLNADGGPLHLMTEGQTRLHATTQGKIGFGVIDPFYDFHYKGPFGGTQMALDADEGNNARLILRRDINPFTGTEKYFELNLIPANTFGTFTDGTFLGNTALLESGEEVDRMAVNADNGPLHLMTGGSTRFLISNNGNIGMGVSDPQDELHLDGDLRLDGDSPSIQFHKNGTWAGYFFHDGTDLTLGNISNNKILLQTNGVNTGVLDNTGLALNRGDHYLKVGNFGPGSSPRIEASNNGTPDVFSILADGVSISKTGSVTSTPYVLRVVEESTPYGLDIFHSDSENHWELYTSSTGDLRLYSNNTFRGAFDAASGAYTEVSDRRFKTNVQPINGVMADIMALKPYRYQYKDNNPEQKESLGFVAQEVASLFPELVQEQKGDRDGGVLSLNYSGFSVLAIHALQEQQKVIEQQQSELEKQAGQLKSLEARLEQLEALLKE